MGTEGALFEIAFARAAAGDLTANQALLADAHHELLRMLRAGTEEQLISERWVTRLGKRQYWRTAKFSGMTEPFLVRWVVVAPGKIGGLGLGPASSAPPIDP